MQPGVHPLTIRLSLKVGSVAQHLELPVCPLDRGEHLLQADLPAADGAEVAQVRLGNGCALGSAATRETKRWALATSSAPT